MCRHKAGTEAVSFVNLSNNGLYSSLLQTCSLVWYLLVHIYTGLYIYLCILTGFIITISYIYRKEPVAATEIMNADRLAQHLHALGLKLFPLLK